MKVGYGEAGRPTCSQRRRVQGAPAARLRMSVPKEVIGPSFRILACPTLRSRRLTYVVAYVVAVCGSMQQVYSRELYK